MHIICQGGIVKSQSSSNACIYYDNSDMSNNTALCRVHEKQVKAGCVVKHCRVVAAGFTC